MCSPHQKRNIHYGPREGRGSRGHWNRREARVPKGYLRHTVLNLLNESPVSGSEIINKINERTDGRWSPSPGSVYPLLSWLRDSGYTTEAKDPEAGVKRYKLTESGKEFLEEHDKRHPDFDASFQEIGSRMRGLAGLPDEAIELHKGFRVLRRSSRGLFDQLRKQYSEETVKEAKLALDEFIAKIDKLVMPTET
ncbi:MAG: PadR family transcriptional regulator [Candidatus Thorarchaeota archaeon]|nr:PadR family transcriptional regulator [Candidatus Thorarchaeota archaeon]